MTVDLSRLDVPLAQLESDLRALTARRLADGAAAEFRHLLDPSDGAFAGLACARPAACSCDSDYPGFAEWVAAREADNRRAREAS